MAAATPTHRPLDRLSLSTLPRLAPDIRRPAYAPEHTAVGVVHLGLGNFHRAHQAIAFEDALSRGEAGWGICGVNLHNAAVCEALQPQDGLYTLIERGESHPRLRVVGAVRECLLAPRSADAVIARLADAQVRIVSLTITEKGYGLNSRGELDLQQADIAADLSLPPRALPRSALGWLAQGLARRRERVPGAALTLMSCDNLSANGRTLQAALTAFILARGDAALADWVATHVSFPCSMVDRIVPATTDIDRETVRTMAGVIDAWPVSTEPFTQWVIEDRFSAGRPDLAASGVQLADDVAGWEDMKLRLLNAAHSCIAYTGLLAGFTTVDQAVAQPALRAAVEQLWAQTIPTLPSTMQPLAPGYCKRLLLRFGNPSLAHRTEQIAADGSKKIPLRWLPTLRRRLALGQDAGILALALAAWLQCLRGAAGTANGSIPMDPLADVLANRIRGAGSRPVEMVRALLSFEPVFGDLATAPGLVDSVAAQTEALIQHGPIRTLAAQAGVARG